MTVVFVRNENGLGGRREMGSGGEFTELHRPTFKEEQETEEAAPGPQPHMLGRPPRQPKTGAAPSWFRIPGSEVE